MECDDLVHSGTECSERVKECKDVRVTASGTIEYLEGWFD